MHRILRPVYAPLINWLRRSLRQRRAAREGVRRMKQEIRSAHESGAALKVVIGAGDTRYAGWVHTDVPYLDATNSSHWARYFERGSIQRILAEHVFEHLTPAQLTAFLMTVRPYLTADARIRIAVPDGNHPNPAYIEYVRPGGTGDGAHDHKVLYTADSLSAAIYSGGFVPFLLEYYDEEGAFHQHPWDAADGHIQRTPASDSPQHRALNYSSLICDCVLKTAEEA